MTSRKYRYYRNPALNLDEPEPDPIFIDLTLDSDEDQDTVVKVVQLESPPHSRKVDELSALAGNLEELAPHPPPNITEEATSSIQQEQKWLEEVEFPSNNNSTECPRCTNRLDLSDSCCMCCETLRCSRCSILISKRVINPRDYLKMLLSPPQHKHVLKILNPSTEPSTNNTYQCTNELCGKVWYEKYPNA